METPEEKGLPPKKRRVQSERGHHQLPSISELAHLGVESESRIEGRAPPAHDELKGKGPVLADCVQSVRLETSAKATGIFTG